MTAKRPEQTGELVATMEMVGSPDGTIAGESPYGAATLEIVDGTTGRTVAVLQPKSIR